MTSSPVRASIVIEQFWAKKVGSVAQGLDALKTELANISCWPSQVLVSSASEVKLLQNPLIDQFCRRIVQNNHCDLVFVSAACTSLHAAILDFETSQADNCLVIILELDQALQQGCLNALGVGNEINQDGLTVINCVGYCVLRRKIPQHQDIVIAQCDIFSQPKQMSGIQILLNQLSPYIAKSSHNSLCVSFDICSVWGKKLAKALRNRLQGQPHQLQHWLASVESDHQHYLSLKPLLELQLYRDKLQQHDLLIFTLGGGGRIGCLKISVGQTAESNIAVSSCSDFNLVNQQTSYQNSLLVKQYSKEAYHAIVKATLKYPQLQYRGINNHYFRWHQDVNNLSGASQ